MKSIDPATISTRELHGYLLGSIAPRPIAFASTVDAEGKINLSPYSFFNVFGSNPPTLIFSPSRRVRDNTNKNTLENIREVPEVVINIVNYAIVQQMSLSSTEYEKGVNEFTKSGLTPVPSLKVKPPRVAESPASFECIVKQVIETGSEGGAGNLIVCEVLTAHIDEDILDDSGIIDPFRLDAVGRMGGNWYCRAQGEALFEVAKPLRDKGIGVDQIPEPIRLSEFLTGNHLGKLGNVASLPSLDPQIQENPRVRSILQSYPAGLPERSKHLHLLAGQLLQEDRVEEAWQVLLLSL